MHNDADGISRSKADAARNVIKKAVQARRWDEGFRQPVPTEQWAANPVRDRLDIAVSHLLGRCGEAEWEELAQDLYPDDEELEGKLLAMERALNGMMTFAVETAPPSGSLSPQGRQEPEEDAAAPTATQAFYLQAATDYLYWLLEDWDWVREYRANLPDAMTEQEMVDFLLSPLSQVLSFADFERLGLCPATTRGRIAITRQWQAPPLERAEAGQKAERGTNVSDDVLFTEFAVEVDRPDGTIIHLTIQREDAPENFGYYSPLFDEDEAAIVKAGGWITKEGYIGFDQGSLGDRGTYPNFPSFFFTAYRRSVGWETYALADTIRENGFCGNMDSNLRFLLMRVRVPLLSLHRYSRGTFVPQWRTEMQTNSNVTVPHWMMPEELAEYWRQVRPKNARERRMPSAANTELFRFVLYNTPPGSEPPWASLARGWNQLEDESITRDKLYKVYHSVLEALFPEHPSKRMLADVRPWPRLPDSLDVQEGPGI